MKFGKITTGLCALMCFAALAGCKDRSEMPPLDDSLAGGSSVTYNSAESSSLSSSQASSQSASQSSAESAQPTESSAHVHNYQIKESAEPKCGEDGYKLFACACGDEYSETLAATEHKYSKTTVEAGCENGGYTRYTCANCGASYDEDVTNPLGHTWGEWEVTRDATTSAAGEKQSTCSRCGKTRSEAVPKLESSVSSGDFASEVVRLVNIERENYGLSPLEERSVLDDYAQLRSKEIVGKFEHERPDGSSPLGYVSELNGIFARGENIAAGQATPADVVSAWMNSPGHRANILTEDFTAIGVGYYKTSSGYRHYWTQIFA